MFRFTSRLKESKPCRRVDLDDIQAGTGLQHGGVGGEPEVDALAAVLDGPLHEGLDEEAVVLQIVDLPDYVIPQAKALNGPQSSDRLLYHYARTYT